MLCRENALYLGQAAMFQCGQSIFSNSGSRIVNVHKLQKGSERDFWRTGIQHICTYSCCTRYVLVCFYGMLCKAVDGVGEGAAFIQGKTPAGNGFWKGLTHQKSATEQRSPPCRAGSISWSRKKVHKFWKLDGVSTSHPVKPQQGWLAAGCTFMFPELASIFSLYLHKKVLSPISLKMLNYAIKGAPSFLWREKDPRWLIKHNKYTLLN